MRSSYNGTSYGTKINNYVKPYSTFQSPKKENMENMSPLMSNNSPSPASRRMSTMSQMKENFK
jgi:hypothetical protein